MGLVVVHVRPPGSPGLALCTDDRAAAIDCTTASDSIAQAVDRALNAGKDALITTRELPLSLPHGVFLLVSLVHPLEAIGPGSQSASPQCSALLPSGESASEASCIGVWRQLSKRCDWIGDVRHARSHRVLVTELVRRGGAAWQHRRPPSEEAKVSSHVPTRPRLEHLRVKHEGDFVLYRLARKEHSACVRGHYVRGEDDTPPYRYIGSRPFESVSHTARGGFRGPNASWTTWVNYSWVAPDCPALHAPEGWCEALHGRRVLYVGDSTQYQTFMSLLGIMQVKAGPSELLLDFKRFRWAHVCGKTNTSVGFVRNDWLVNPTWHMGCSWSELRDVRQICRYWEDSVLALSARDVAVLSKGAHVIEPTERRLNHTYALAYALNKSEPLLVWRNAVAGHDGCCEEGAPRTEPLSSPYKAPPHHKHGWDKIGRYDDEVFDIFESVMPRRVHYVDDARLLNVRQDRHICGTKDKTGDCLHYFLPGPPDVSNLVLRHVLTEVREGADL